MDGSAEVEGYKPSDEFEQDSRDPLVDLTSTDSTELWLLQWPPNQLPDFHGKEISLSLQRGGCLGSFEGLSGKIYDLVNCVGQGQDPTVFLSSASGTKIVGKISRQVSFVHYPEPKELEEQEAEKKSKRQFLAGTAIRNSLTQSHGSKLRNPHSSRVHASSAHSSRNKSSLSQAKEESHHKRRRIHKTTGSTDRSTLESGKES